jgi:Tat protein translocase TatB subunit
MFGLGMSELILLGVLALIIIGPKQLPEVARTLGRLINDIKRSTEGLTDEIKKQAGMDFEVTDFMNQRKQNAAAELLRRAQEEDEKKTAAAALLENESNGADGQMAFDVEPKPGQYVSEETRKGHGDKGPSSPPVNDNKKDDSNG